MPYCPKCGKRISANAKFCVNCGHRLKEAAVAPKAVEASTTIQHSDLGSRIAAGLIDYIILGIIGVILSFAFAPFIWMGTMPNDWSGGWMMPGFRWGLFSGMFVIQFLLWIVYFTYFEGTSGQTIGKKIVKIKVVNEDGSKCEFGAALIRTILRIVDHFPFLYILGIILIAATDKKQRLGDMLAKTLVVKVSSIEA